MVKYIGSAEHRKILHDAKRDILEIIRIASEYCLHNNNSVLEAQIREVWEGYKKL